MNSVSLALVTLVLGIDVGWQPLDGGGLEYIIQIEPQLLSTLREGQDIVSDLPPALEGVKTCRVTVGTGRVPRVANCPTSSATASASPQSITANQPFNQGVLNLPPPPTDFAPANPSVLNLPPPPTDDFFSQPTPSNAWQSRETPMPQSRVPQSRTQPAPVQPSDPLAAPPSNFATPTAPANRTRSTAPVQQPERFADQVPVPAAPIPAAAPAEQNIEKVYQLEILNAKLPSGFVPLADEGPELMAVPKSSSKPIPAATTDSSPNDTASALTAEGKPWGWLILTLLALSLSVGLNFFLGWVTWGFRQRYEALLDRFHSARARTA